MEGKQRYPSEYGWRVSEQRVEKPLAMAYVTPQPQINNVYGSGEALQRGTLFPELFKPFMGNGGGR